MAATPTRYARGGNLSNVPKAAEVPPADLSKLLGVDSSNPFLRNLRIQQGLLRKEALPSELQERVAPEPLKVPGVKQ